MSENAELRQEVSRSQRFTAQDWQKRLSDALKDHRPYLGHMLHPVPLLEPVARTVKISSYVELDFARFLEQYAARIGSRSVSESIRRLAIIGAMAEGYVFDDQEP